MRSKLSTALLDTNILLLWLVAQTDSSLLLTFKRVSTFTVDDLSLLGGLLKTFQNLITTPHVLVEVSNFVDQAPLYRRPQLVKSLKIFVESHLEIYQRSTLLVSRDEFPLLGLTDTALVALSGKAVIVTTDFHLWGRVISQGGQSINFNHLRTSQLLM